MGEKRCEASTYVGLIYINVVLIIVQCVLYNAFTILNYIIFVYVCVHINGLCTDALAQTRLQYRALREEMDSCLHDLSTL